jgi:hypothetical protein
VERGLKSKAGNVKDCSWHIWFPLGSYQEMAAQHSIKKQVLDIGGLSDTRIIDLVFCHLRHVPGQDVQKNRTYLV